MILRFCQINIFEEKNSGAKSPPDESSKSLKKHLENKTNQKKQIYIYIYKRFWAIRCNQQIDATKNAPNKIAR